MLSYVFKSGDTGWALYKNQIQPPYLAINFMFIIQGGVHCTYVTHKDKAPDNAMWDSPD